MRTPAAVLALGLTLAIGTPAAWALTRPDPAAGVPVAAALAAAPETAPEAAPEPGPVTGPLPDRLPTATARPAAPAPAATVVPPVRLSVPALGIDAPVDPVGVEPEGEMTLPGDVDRVGWYRFGPAPGAAEGTAVVAGHVDDAEQGLGALAPLRAAEPGDELLVEAADGAVSRWQVVSRELIRKPGVPLGDLFTRSGPARLAVITCGGPFDAELRSYRDNVVVVAVPVP
ncbi:class F sortase [Modestobacter lapidis]|nr:class F sortase [Modestobacter lapidis]